MRCRFWESPVSLDATRCAGCGASLASEAPSLFERISRQVEADHGAWRRDWRATAAAPLPAVSAPASGVSAPTEAAARRPGSGGDPSLEVEAVGMLNLLLLHGGFSPFRRLAVAGLPEGTVAHLEIAAQPKAVLQRTVPLVVGAEAVERPALAPDLAYFAAHEEAVAGSLEVTLTAEGRPPLRRSLPVTVQPANEWIDQPGAEAALAGAVTPNGAAVADLAAALEGDFMAYQRADRGRRRQEVEAVYRRVVGAGLKYVGNPPSFEGTGQKVLFPDQTLSRRQGCCLDIALLEASVLERLGYRPLVFLLRHRERGTGHALCGVWLADVRAQSPLLRDVEVLQPLLDQGDLLVWNSTSSFEGLGDDFRSVERAGREWMQHVSYALDIAACRSAGLKPVPRGRP